MPLSDESTTLLGAAKRVIEESGNRSCRPGEPPSRHVNARAFDALVRAVAALESATQDEGTYEESDVPKWKLGRFQDWLRKGAYDA